jgi:hypothetical protein
MTQINARASENQQNCHYNEPSRKEIDMTVLTFHHVGTDGGFFEQWPRFTALLAVWRQRSQNRDFLAHLDHYQRAKLGAPLSAVEREIEKPFWQA